MKIYEIRQTVGCTYTYLYGGFSSSMLCYSSSSSYSSFLKGTHITHYSTLHYFIV